MDFSIKFLENLFFILWLNFQIFFLQAAKDKVKTEGNFKIGYQQGQFELMTFWNLSFTIMAFMIGLLG